MSMFTVLWNKLVGGQDTPTKTSIADPMPVQVVGGSSPPTGAAVSKADGTAFTAADPIDPIGGVASDPASPPTAGTAGNYRRILTDLSGRVLTAAAAGTQADLGAKADAAVTDPTAAASVIAALKGQILRQQLFESSVVYGGAGGTITPDVVMGAPVTFLPPGATYREVLTPVLTIPNAARANGGSGKIVGIDFVNWIDPALGKWNAAITADATTDLITLAGHGMVVNQRVQITNLVTANLPGGLTAGTSYYVQSVPDANTFKLSATYGGAAIDITSNGSGNVLFEMPVLQAYSSPLVYLSTVTPGAQTPAALLVPSAASLAASLASPSPTVSQQLLGHFTGSVGSPATPYGYKCAAGDTNLYLVLGFTSSTQLVMNVREMLRVTFYFDRNG